MAGERKKYIDMIRAFSACLIILYHFSGYIRPAGFSAPLLYGFANGNWGNVGVFLFFMISGNSLMTKYEHTFDSRSFFKNRFLKILIPFWMCYVLAFLFRFCVTKTFPELPLYKFVYTLIGMDGFLSYKTATFYLIGEWFLGSIIILYLLFPLVRFGIRKNIHVVLLVLFGLNCLLYYNNLWGFFQISVARNPLVGLFYFVLGVWIDRMSGIVRRQPMLKKLIVGFIVVLLSISLFVKLPLSIHFGNMLTTVLLYLLFLYLEQIVTNQLILKGIGQLAQRSYLIFLTHHIIIQTVAAHFADREYSLKGVLCILLICVLLIFAVTEWLHKLQRLIFSGG